MDGARRARGRDCPCLVLSKHSGRIPYMARIPECGHPDRAYQAKGMCKQCYFKQYDKGRAGRNRKEPSKYAENYRKPPRRPARISECHPERKHVAHGQCGPCYRQGGAMATCHPDKRLVADGLCTSCYSKRRYDQDPEKARQLSRESQKRGRDKLRTELLAAYGGKCACPKCPEGNPAFLTLEHVGGGGGEHRKQVGSHAYADLRRRGFPQEGYALLCWNCNSASRFTGVCPHML